MSITALRSDGYILITGGAGFLGTNIAAALARRGEQVLVFDNLSRPHRSDNVAWLKAHHRNITVTVADIRDAEAVGQAVRGARAIVHLAAQVAVTTSVADPVTDFEINARGTLNILEAVRHLAPDAPLLFASTNKVYGALIGRPALRQTGSRYQPRESALLRGFDERTPLSLYSPYGCSKGAAEQYVLDYTRIYNLRAAVLRMSCIYGPHQYGTEDQGWIAHLMICAMQAAPITIYGDGYQVRDVLYVDDAVDAYLRGLEQIDRISGHAFNLGGGAWNTLSLRELLQWIEEKERIKPQVSMQSWRPGDQPWYVSNTAAFTRHCGWQAQTNVESGLQNLWAWLSHAVANAQTQRGAVA